MSGPVYKIGSTDIATIKRIQEFLNIPITGVFDAKMDIAVKTYQSRNNLIVDGIVGRDTLHSMGILDTDLSGKSHYVTPAGLHIQCHHLPTGEYIQDSVPILNDYLILHHTAGWDNPYNVIDQWARDNRGCIGTEFVIGGQRITNDKDENDGVVVQAFPAGCQAWHAASSYSSYLNRHSVGIELCNFGQLNSENKTYTGTIAKESQIITLDEPYKGYTKFHKYSNKQLYALKQLIQYIGSRDNIDIRKGIVEWIEKDGPVKAFDYRQDAAEGKVKGMLTHGNIVKSKLDVHPQQELVDMLLSL